MASSQNLKEGINVAEKVKEYLPENAEEIKKVIDQTAIEEIEASADEAERILNRRKKASG